MPYLYVAKSMEDFDDYFRIKSDKTAVLWSGFKSGPDRGKLYAHFGRLINECIPRGDILVYLKDDVSGDLLGYDLMTKIDETTVESSGHSILSEWQGKGYGTLLFKLLVDFARGKGFERFTGWISENNIGSIKNVEKNGFKRTDEFRVDRLEAFNREDKFYKYVCDLKR